MTKHPLFDYNHTRAALAQDVLCTGVDSPEAIRAYDAIEDLLIAIMENHGIERRLEWLKEYLFEYAVSVENNVFYKDVLIEFDKDNF